jgi:signal peptide peptidase-like protein 2B
MKKANNQNVFLFNFGFIFFIHNLLPIFSLEVRLKNRNITVVNDTFLDNFFDINKSDSNCDCSSKSYFWEYLNNSTKFIINTSQRVENIYLELRRAKIQTKLGTNILNRHANKNLNKINLNFSLKNLNFSNNKNFELTIEHECRVQEDWYFIHVEIFTGLVDLQRYEFGFIKFCQSPELVSSSSFTLVLLFIFSVVVIIFSTYSEIKFELTEVKPGGEIKFLHGILLIISGSAVLLLIFYFYIYIDIIFTMLISLQIGLALYLCLKSGYEYLELHSLLKLKYLNKKVFNGKYEIYSMIFLLLSFSIVLIYIVTRHWILNNIFGFCLVFTILSIFHIRSFKICVVLLSFAFFYDVFWVYISPLLFQKNVMVFAASSLNLPIKFEIPIFLDEHPLKSCMFLGLGDLVLPGLVIKFCHRFDFLKNSKVYYLTALLLYSLSLSLSGMVVVLFNSPQPVLFYVSPFLLFGITLIAYRRGEIEIWNAEILEENLIMDLENMKLNEVKKNISNYEMESHLYDIQNKSEYSSDPDTNSSEGVNIILRNNSSI